MCGDEALSHLRSVDGVLAAVIHLVGPQPETAVARADHLTTLARAIVSQQLSGKAAETIWGRLTALFPNPRKLEAELILAASEQSMRGAGLSAAKVASLKDVAARADVFRGLARRGDEDIIERLVAIRGVGRWTAQMYLMFHLERPDVWPVGDLGIRNAVTRLYGADADLDAVAEPWRPFRTCAARYLWRSLELAAT